MSWEQQDSLARKVREARERKKLTDVTSVQDANRAQDAVGKRREAEQQPVRQERADRERRAIEGAKAGPSQNGNGPGRIHHVRDGRADRER